MLFFKRILDVRKAPESTSNRRVASRFIVHDTFPLKAVLNIVGRDEMGQPLKSRHGEGWDWPGRLVNLSTTGARVQVPPKIMVQRGDFCRLKLDVEGYQLLVPGHIAHVSEHRDSFIFGLVLDLSASNTQACYRQLIDLVAMGSSLKLEKEAKADDSGYLVEQYAGEPASLLKVWRHKDSNEISAFEFLLRDCFVRGLAGETGIECFKGTDPATARAATTAQGTEIKRLYQWVVLNLPATIPGDVSAFLLAHAH
jgi:hypothetical protein